MAAPTPDQPLRVALCGNPNTGKTTLFNQLTGRRAHVGNYPGVTVEQRAGDHRCADGQLWRVHDLPGAYSLTAHSPEEEIAHQALTGHFGEPPQVVVVVLDASNLARNLLLLLQVAELGLPVVAALNMMDAADQAGLSLDLPGLQADLGCPCVPLVARNGQGLPELEVAVRAVAERPERGAVAETAWSEAVLRAIASARTCDPRLQTLTSGAVLWWLCAEASLVDRLQPGLGQALSQAVPRDPLPDVDLRRRVVHERYQRIDAIVAARVGRQAAPQRSLSDRIDDVLLHPLVGGALFVVAMAG
ncbi:MAG: 50S ribosome-binding GTPase, partial [Deltaproteobacteria bacterium]|nr:50S ribosome-binding GTPase [Deltaproteobacteria bacterium]